MRYGEVLSSSCGCPGLGPDATYKTVESSNLWACPEPCLWRKLPSCSTHLAVSCRFLQNKCHYNRVKLLAQPCDWFRISPMSNVNLSVGRAELLHAPWLLFISPESKISVAKANTHPLEFHDNQQWLLLKNFQKKLLTSLVAGWNGIGSCFGALNFLLII